MGSNGWRDERNYTLNFLIALGDWLVFFKAINTSNIVKGSENLGKILEEVVLDVGRENVIQVVIVNATTYLAARKLLESRHLSCHVPILHIT